MVDLSKEVEEHRKAVVKYLYDVAKLYKYHNLVKIALNTCAKYIKEKHGDTLPKKLLRKIK